MFRRWAQQPGFRRTWKSAKSTYAERFRNFYNDRLRGRQMRLPRRFVAYREQAAGKTAAETLKNFNAAIQAGASVIELEVRRLGSDQIVVYQGDAMGGRTIEQSTVDDLKQAGCSILGLEDCLDELRGKIRLCVALKTNGIEGRALCALRTAGWDFDNYALSSHDRKVIRNLRDLSSDVKLGLHLEKKDDFEEAFRNFLLTGADYLAPKESLMDAETLSRAREARIPLVPWIVNDSKRLRFFLSHDAVAGIISNDVDLALSIKAELS